MTLQTAIPMPPFSPAAVLLLAAFVLGLLFSRNMRYAVFGGLSEALRALSEGLEALSSKLFAACRGVLKHGVQVSHHADAPSGEAGTAPAALRDTKASDEELGTYLVAIFFQALTGIACAFLLLADYALGALRAPTFYGFKNDLPPLAPASLALAVVWWCVGIVYGFLALELLPGFAQPGMQLFPNLPKVSRHILGIVGLIGLFLTLFANAAVGAYFGALGLGSNLNEAKALVNIIQFPLVIGASAFAFMILIRILSTFGGLVLWVLGVVLLALRLVSTILMRVCDHLAGTPRGAKSGRTTAHALTPSGSIGEYKLGLLSVGATIRSLAPRVRDAMTRFNLTDQLLAWADCPINARTGLPQAPDKRDRKNISLSASHVERAVTAVRDPREYDETLATLQIEEFVGKARPKYLDGMLLTLTDVESLAALVEPLRLFSGTLPRWTTILVVCAPRIDFTDATFQAAREAAQRLQENGGIGAVLWIDEFSPLSGSRSRTGQYQLVSHGLAASLAAEETTLVSLLSRLGANEAVGIATASVNVVAGKPLPASGIRTFLTGKEFTFGDVDVACAQALTAVSRVMQDMTTRTVSGAGDLHRLLSVLVLTCPFRTSDSERYETYTQDTETAVRMLYPSIRHIAFAEGSGYPDETATTATIFVQATLYFGLPSLDLLEEHDELPLELPRLLPYPGEGDARESITLPRPQRRIPLEA